MGTRDRLPLEWLLLRGEGWLDWIRRTIVTISVAVTTMLLFGIAAILQIKPSNGPYSNELLQNSSFHWGLVFGLLFILLPVAFLLGQATRIGSPSRASRDERLRLVGAPRALLARVALAEAAAIGIVGFGAGLSIAAVVQALFGEPHEGLYKTQQVVSDADGVVVIQIDTHRGDVLSLPTDVSLSLLSIILCGAAVIACTLAWTMLALAEKGALRRFGRNVGGPIYAKTRTVLPLLALASFAFFSFNHPGASSGTTAGYMVVGFIGVLAILVLWAFLSGSNMLARLAGFMASRVQRPTALLALRRLQSNASNSARATYGSIGVLTLVGFARGTKEYILAVSSNPADGSAQALTLVDLASVVLICVAVGMVGIALAESIPRQRREWAMLLACGTPKRTLRGALVLEGSGPMLLFAPASLGLGIVASRLFFGGSYRELDSFSSAVVVKHVPVPWADLVSLSAVALAVIALISLVVGVSAGSRISMEEVKYGL